MWAYADGKLTVSDLRLVKLLTGHKSGFIEVSLVHAVENNAGQNSKRSSEFNHVAQVADTPTGRVEKLAPTIGQREPVSFAHARIDDTNDCLKSIEEYQEFQMTTMGYSFSETVSYLIKKQKLNRVLFYEKTLIDHRQFSRILKNEVNNPRFDTVIAICIGLNLGLLYGEPLLRKCGYTLDCDSKAAYKVLLASYCGRSITECNEYLVAQGLKPLLAKNI